MWGGDRALERRIRLGNKKREDKKRKSRCKKKEIKEKKQVIKEIKEENK